MSRPAGLLPALAGMLVLAVAIGIGRFAFTPVLPMMQQDHALSISTAAWLASANYIGYFLGALSAVWLRYSPRLMIVIALTAIALTTIGMGFWHQPAIWLLLRTIAGITSAWALVFASAWVLPILAQLGQLRLGGLMFAGVGLGTSLAGIACLLFLIFAWTSDQAWIALGLLAVGCMVVLGLIQRSPVFPASPPVTPRAEAAHRSSTRSGSQGEIANQPFRFFLLPIICYGLFGFGYIIPATFLPTMAKTLIPDPLLFGWAWPVFGLAALSSTLLAGWLSARVHNRTIWAVSHLVMALGVSVPVLWPGLGGILLSALGVGGTFVVATLTGMQEARRIAPPQQAQSLMAAMTAAFALGQIVGPLLVNLLGSQADDFSTPLLIAALAIGGSGIVLLWSDKTGS